mmetsp:Transcript_152411/g.486990  ORF Transcript_152411/g.486990 Transcript_152411/m.486990 type:complete len:162 (-) Transcript_152411:10-495(-)
MARCVALLLLAAPAAAFVTPGSRPGAAIEHHAVGAAQMPVFEELAAEESSAWSVAAASIGVGAMLGWLNARRQQVASVAGAAALAMAPAAGLAIVDYDAVKYLGGSDKVDINNANVQAYRQFPGMYPTAAGAIGSPRPHKSVKDIYDIPGPTEQGKGIMKK